MCMSSNMRSCIAKYPVGKLPNRPQRFTNHLGRMHSNKPPVTPASGRVRRVPAMVISTPLASNHSTDCSFRTRLRPCPLLLLHQRSDASLYISAKALVSCVMSSLTATQKDASETESSSALPLYVRHRGCGMRLHVLVRLRCGVQRVAQQ